MATAFTTPATMTTAIAPSASRTVEDFAPANALANHMAARGKAATTQTVAMARPAFVRVARRSGS